MKTFFILLIIALIPAIGIGAFDRAISHSMEPTLFVGDWYVENFLDRDPQVGEIVSFHCRNTEKCKDGATHRITSINEKGCMEILGDNQSNSLDTRDYGCLMPSDIRILGTVHPLKTFFSEKATVSTSESYDLEDEMRAIHAEEEADQEDLYRGTR